MPRPEERLAHARFSPKNSSPNRRPIDRLAELAPPLFPQRRRRHEPNPPPPTPPGDGQRRQPAPDETIRPPAPPCHGRPPRSTCAPRPRVQEPLPFSPTSGPAATRPRHQRRTRPRSGDAAAGRAHRPPTTSRLDPELILSPPIYSPPRTPRRDIATERADSKQLSSAALCFPSRRKLRALLERVCLPTSPARAP